MQRSRHLLARVGIGILAPTLAVTLAAPAQARNSPARPDIAADWLAQTIAAAGKTGTAPSAARAWAIAWLSAHRALDTAGAVAPAQRAGFEDAAVATAVHDVLWDLVAARTNPPADTDTLKALDTALKASLQAIPDGPGEQAGANAGKQQADRTLNEREHDGLDPTLVNRPFPDPPPAPGGYRTPSDATTSTRLAGMGDARPFVLDRADQFRPGPPPALDGDTYRRDREEVRRVGSATASPTERTPEQTDIAKLWGQDVVNQFNAVLRPLVDQDQPLAWKVRLLATFSVANIDTRIAAADTKFAYLRWRPITAIQEADTNPDPTWTPLRPTPAVPEYTGSSWAGGATQILARFTGPRTPVPFTITVTTDEGQVISRDYPRGTPWSALAEEMINAGIWLGTEFRTSNKVGSILGRQIADHVLARLR